MFRKVIKMMLFSKKKLVKFLFIAINELIFLPLSDFGSAMK